MLPTCSHINCPNISPLCCTPPASSLIYPLSFHLPSLILSILAPLKAASSPSLLPLCNLFSLLLLTVPSHLLHHLQFHSNLLPYTNTLYNCPKYFSASLHFSPQFFLSSYLLSSLSPFPSSHLSGGLASLLSQGDSEHLELLPRYVKQFIRRRVVRRPDSGPLVIPDVVDDNP